MQPNKSSEIRESDPLANDCDSPVQTDVQEKNVKDQVANSDASVPLWDKQNDNIDAVRDDEIDDGGALSP